MRTYVFGLMIVLLAVVSAQGSWIPVSSFPTQQVCEMTSRQLPGGVWQVDLSVPGVRIDNAPNSMSEVMVSLPGEAMVGEDGAAELPSISRWIVLLQSGDPTVNVLSEEWTELPGEYRLAAESDNVNQTNSKTLANSETFIVSKRQILGGVPVAALQIKPVKYNVDQQKLQVLRHISLTIRESGNPSPLPRQIPETVAGLLRPATLNYGTLSVSTLTVRGTYLYVMARDTFSTNGIQDLINWRWKQGFKVEAVGPTAVAAAGYSWTNSGIKGYILTRYQAANPPLEYICLIGDPAGSYTIPCFTYSIDSSPGAGDLDYTLQDGTDLLPDVAIGRFCMTSADELRKYVTKTLLYERNPSSPSGGTRDNWYKGALVTAASGSSGISTVYLMRTAREYLLNAGYPSANIDTLYYINSGAITEENMNASINAGLSVWFYRGYYQMTGYGETSGPAGMNNYRRWPFVIDITCSTNDYDVATNDVSENIMVAGNDANMPNGAIGVAGMSSAHTNTRYNNILEAGSIQGLLQNGIHSMGGAIWNGRLEVRRNYIQTDSARVQFINGICNLLGDPAVDVYTDTPETLLVNAPATMAAGTNYLSLNVTNSLGQSVSGVYVNLLKGSTSSPQVFVGDWTDASGHVTLNFQALSPAENLYLTCTKHNCRPIIDTVAVQTNVSEVSPPTSTYTINDDNVAPSHGNSDGKANPGEAIELTIPLKNWGTTTINGVNGVLSTADSYIPSIPSNSRPYGTITAGSTVSPSGVFYFNVASYAPNGHIVHFLFTVTDNASHVWMSDIPITLANAKFTADSIHLAAVGNGILDPGETGQISFYLYNAGQLASPNNASATLSSDNPAVTISAATKIFGTAAIGAHVNNAANPFTISASTFAYPGERVPLTMIFPLANGFADTIHYTLTIGTVASNSPCPADAYGYWAFDNTDGGYAKRPVGADTGWVEIDPRFGGTGTLLPILDNTSDADASCAVNLPFSFQYYGASFDQIAVCSNGWIAMGAEEAAHTDFRNYLIPSAIGPFRMIAPFWDDLQNSIASEPPAITSGKIPTKDIAFNAQPDLPKGASEQGARGHSPFDQGNDWCPATVIPSLPYTDSGSTVGMTNNQTTSSTGCSNTVFAGPDVIYSYTTTTSDCVRVDVCTSSYDTGLMIRTGGTCPGTTQVVCNDDNSTICTAHSQGSSVTTRLAASTTYWIIVDGYNGASGTYTLNMTVLQPPVQCSNAAVIAALPYTSSGTTCGHMSSYGNAAPDTFYKYTVPTGGEVVSISLCNSSFDTYLRVWQPCGVTQIASDDNSCGGTNASILQNFSAGDIWIQVEGTGSLCGNYTLNVTHVNPCGDAIVIPSIPYSNSGTTVGHPNYYGNEAPDVFYRYTVPPGGDTLQIDLCGSSYDTYLRVWRPCGTTQLAVDDDACGSLSSKIQQYFTAGDIWIQVEGYGSASGNYSLQVAHYSPPPPPTPAGIYSYYDAANHRFIVEWSRLTKYPNDSTETFECILYQPGYPSTPTGDGEILFQYNHIANTSDAYASNDYCTVGIENLDKTDGVMFSYAGLSSPSIPGAAPLISGRSILFTTAKFPIDTPQVPENLTAYLDGDHVKLTWSQVRQDVHGAPMSGVQYKIYAGSTSEFTPDITSLLATVSDTSYSDFAITDNMKFYRVKAYIPGIGGILSHPSDVPNAAVKTRVKTQTRTTPTKSDR
jgi:hypothetical protein